MSINEQCDINSQFEKIQKVLCEKNYNTSYIGKVFFDMISADEEYMKFLEENLNDCEKKPFSNNIGRQELAYLLLKNKEIISPIRYYSLSKNGRLKLDRSAFDIIEGIKLHYSQDDVLQYKLYFECSYPKKHMKRYFTENIPNDDNIRFPYEDDNPFENFYVPFFEGKGNFIRFPVPIPIYKLAYGKIILEVKLKNSGLLCNLPFIEPISYTVKDYKSNDSVGKKLMNFFINNLASEGNNLNKVMISHLN